jgi:hypothetical protein
MDRLLQFDVTHAYLVVFVAVWVDVITLPLVAGRLWWSAFNFILGLETFTSVAPIGTPSVAEAEFLRGGGGEN